MTHNAINYDRNLIERENAETKRMEAETRKARLPFENMSDIIGSLSSLVSGAGHLSNWGKILQNKQFHEDDLNLKKIELLSRFGKGGSRLPFKSWDKHNKGKR